MDRFTEVRLRSTLRPMLRQFKHVPPRWEQPRTGVLSCPTLCATSRKDWSEESLPVALPPRASPRTCVGSVAFSVGSRRLNRRIRRPRIMALLWAAGCSAVALRPRRAIERRRRHQLPLEIRLRCHCHRDPKNPPAAPLHPHSAGFTVDTGPEDPAPQLCLSTAEVRCRERLTLRRELEASRPAARGRF